MYGHVAVTHADWYGFLARRPFWDEVNFWRPSAHHSFNGVAGSPFLFKLKAPHNAIGGFGLVATFSRLPEWLAWECFGEANGAASFSEMESRLNEIRTRNRFVTTGAIPQIGCILLSNVVLFPRDMWIAQPIDWAPRNLTYQRYNLGEGEGARIWRECQDRVVTLRSQVSAYPVSAANEVLMERDRFGPLRLIKPRLGQGTFRVAVTDAYERACTITGEHSLPVLEACHIKPYSQEGPHAISNGLLLRADLHRLFDLGYLTVTPDHRLKVSARLRVDYDNGRTYYPLDGRPLKIPRAESLRPSSEFLTWHNEQKFRI